MQNQKTMATKNTKTHKNRNLSRLLVNFCVFCGYEIQVFRILPPDGIPKPQMNPFDEEFTTN